jgi:antirestriction protein
MSHNFFSRFENLNKDDKQVDKLVDDNIKVRKSKGRKFTHSIYGMVIGGPKKGNEVEIRYVLPSKIEVEVGMNIDIRSSKLLKIGDVVNNCVILSRIDNETYLSHCKRSVFFSENDLRINNDEAKILTGEFKNQRGIIKSRQVAKVGVAFMDGTVSIFDLSDIFYKDLLLKNDKYFNVIDVNMDVIRGKEIGDDSIKEITLKDIKRMMPGFKLRDYIEEYKQLEDEDEKVFMHSELSSEIGSDSELDNEYEGEGESKASFKDIQRTSVVFSGWTREQKEYIKIIKNILNNIDINEDNMNMSDILDDIQGSLENVIKMIGDRNFDIMNSSIDIRMIIACIVAYNVIKKNEFNFSSMKEYVNHLFKLGYFVGDVSRSVLVELPDVFACKDLRRTRVDLEKINMLMNCFDNILQKVLNRIVDISRGKASVIEYEAIKRREKKYEKRMFLLPSDLKNISKEDINKKILWNPTYKDRIEKWRSHIKGKIGSSEGIKQNIYEFIEKNIEKSPLVLFGLRMELIDFLRARYPEITLDGCEGDKQCEEDIITKYINMVTSDMLDKSGKAREVQIKDYELVQRYKSMRDFTNKFIEDIDKVKEYTKEDRLRELSSDLGSSTLQTRNIKGPRDRMIGWLSKRFGYKLDDTCKDDLCKDRDIVSKLKEILSKYRNKLSDVEMDMVEDFISETEIVEEPPKQEQRRIPEIILKINKDVEKLDDSDLDSEDYIEV